MPRYVAYLSAVSYGVVRVGEILRPLVGVGALYVKSYAVTEMPFESGIDIHPAYLHISEVHHHPAVLRVAFGYGYYLVVYLVEVAVGFDVEVGLHQCADRRAESACIFDPAVILRRLFRLKLGVTHVGIVEVVESGHTESLFVECPDKQLFF